MAGIIIDPNTYMPQTNNERDLAKNGLRNDGVPYVEVYRGLTPSLYAFREYARRPFNPGDIEAARPDASMSSGLRSAPAGLNPSDADARDLNPSQYKYGPYAPKTAPQPSQLPASGPQLPGIRPQAPQAPAAFRPPTILDRPVGFMGDALSYTTPAARGTAAPAATLASRPAAPSAPALASAPAAAVPLPPNPRPRVAQPATGFDRVVPYTLGYEGKYTPNDGGGYPANFGINQRANSDIDVKKLTRQGAIDIYRNRYWNQIPGIEKLPPNMQLAVFDTAVNHGPSVAQELMKQYGTDPKAFLAARMDRYRRDKNWATYGKGWTKRMARLEKDMQGMSHGGVIKGYNASGVVPKRPKGLRDMVACARGGVIGDVKDDMGKDTVPAMVRPGEYLLNPETVATAFGGGDHDKGVRKLNSIVRGATGQEPGATPIGDGMEGFENSGATDDKETLKKRVSKIVRGVKNKADNWVIDRADRIKAGRVGGESSSASPGATETKSGADVGKAEPNWRYGKSDKKSRRAKPGGGAAAAGGSGGGTGGGSPPAGPPPGPEEPRGFRSRFQTQYESAGLPSGQGAIKFAKSIGPAVGKAANFAAKTGVRAAPWVAVPLVAKDVYTAVSEGGPGDIINEALGQAARIGGSALGGAAGAFVSGPAAPVGAAVGGYGGYELADKGVRWAREQLGMDPRDPSEIIAERRAAQTQPVAQEAPTAQADEKDTRAARVLPSAGSLLPPPHVDSDRLTNSMLRYEASLGNEFAKEYLLKKMEAEARVAEAIFREGGSSDKAAKMFTDRINDHFSETRVDENGKVTKVLKNPERAEKARAWFAELVKRDPNFSYPTTQEGIDLLLSEYEKRGRASDRFNAYDATPYEKKLTDEPRHFVKPTPMKYADVFDPHIDWKDAVAGATRNLFDPMNQDADGLRYTDTATGHSAPGSVVFYDEKGNFDKPAYDANFPNGLRR